MSFSGLFVTVAEADTYFVTRPESADWYKLSTDAEKTAYLTRAQRQLEMLQGYDLAPDEGEAADDDVKAAIFEQSLWLVKFGQGEERRSALRSQGVRRSGMVSETLDSGPPSAPTIAPEALELIKNFPDESDGANFPGQFPISAR